MNIISAILTDDDISLVTDDPVARLVLSYGTKLQTTYTENSINSTSVTITKETLGLTTLNNNYFKIDVFDLSEETDLVGLYNLEVENESTSKLYNANRLKQELDNLNFFDRLVSDLTNEYKDLEAANNVFYNYKNFLENEIYANSFLTSIDR